MAVFHEESLLSYTFRSLLARLWRQPQSRRPQSCRQTSLRTRSFRPQLEALEHRLVPAGTASISGSAFVDVTGNGLSAGDAPQAGVQVVLLAANDHGNHHGDDCDHGYHEVAN